MRKNVSVLLIILFLLIFSGNILAQGSIINLNEVYTYSQLTNDIEILEQKYPELIKTELLGKSVDNRDISLLKVGKGETNVVLWGGLHAREIASTPVIMKLIETYCEGYNNNSSIDGYNVKELLNKVTFHIIPLANPDGYVLATEGIDKIQSKALRDKLRNISSSYYYPLWKANINGVDLNRNFPVKLWGVIETPPRSYYNTKPSYAYYGGPSAGSEPETQILVNFLESINFYGFIDFHNRGEIIYWEKDFENSEYNRLQKEIATTFKSLSGYRPVDPTEEIIVDGKEGNSTDFVSEKYGKPAFTIESVIWNADFPIDPKHFEIAYNKIKAIPLYFAERLIELEDSNYYKYKVYKDDNFLKDFNGLEKAVEYAKKYNNTFINENLSLNGINIDKNGLQSLGTKIKYTVDADGFSLRYAYQVYKGNERVYKTTYSRNNIFEYTPNEEGRYKVKVFVKDEVGNSDIIYSSDLDIIENGYNYKYDINNNIITKYKEDGSYNYSYKYYLREDGTINYKLAYNTEGNKIAKYTYNDKSECRYKYVYNNGAFKYKYEYNNGKKIAKYTYYIDSNGKYRYKYKYVYDNNGVLLYKYEYNNGKKIAKYTYYIDSNGKYRYKYKYVYDNNGVLLYKYEYNDGKKIAKYTYYIDSKGQYRYKYKYVYDNSKLQYKYGYSNGKKIAKYTYYIDDNGKYRYKYKYIYDTTGKYYIKRYTYYNGEIIHVKTY